MRDYTNKTDAELMRLIARADERAFSELYDRYEKNVYSLVYFKLKNAQDAEEAAQDVFLRLWRHARTYSERGSVGAFVAAVAKNAAADFLRRKEEATVALVSENADGEEITLDLPDTDTPEDEALRRESIGEVQRAIASLPEHYREALVLCDINGMSYRDAADALGTEVGTVKSRLSRARRALREALKEHYENNFRENGNKSADAAVNISERRDATYGKR